MLFLADYKYFEDAIVVNEKFPERNRSFTIVKVRDIEHKVGDTKTIVRDGFDIQHEIDPRDVALWKMTLVDSNTVMVQRPSLPYLQRHGKIKTDCERTNQAKDVFLQAVSADVSRQTTRTLLRFPPQYKFARDLYLNETEHEIDSQPPIWNKGKFMVGPTEVKIVRMFVHWKISILDDKERVVRA